MSQPPGPKGGVELGGGQEPAGLVGQWAEFEAMGTVVRLRADGIDPAQAARLARQAERLTAELEALLSRFNPGSDVSRLQDAGGQFIRVDSRTAEVLEASVRWREVTGKAFDVCLGSGELSSDASGRWRLTQGAKLDLGGIAKGYVADLLRDLYTCAAGALVVMGGSSISAAGRPSDGTVWRIGLRAPGHGPDQTFGTVELASGALSTSGDYVRQAEEGRGMRHRRAMILDPRTRGAPATEVLSATVLADQGMAAEALSTAAIVLGWSGLARIHAAHPEFEAVLVTETAVLATPQLAGVFQPRTKQFAS
ncbi:MAG: FAD:protein FMN transferase [Bifidobacteriaceae bacterium]|jgi:thiamine biosynthesis lipoprotein|nr:FAD:protein FMN transferase [Bifidobacteriaceae bacterium]